MALDDVYATEARFLQHLQIQALNIDAYKSELQASGPQIDATKDDAENCEWLIENCNQMDDCKMAMFAAKRSFLGNKTSPPIGTLPTPGGVPIGGEVLLPRNDHFAANIAILQSSIWLQFSISHSQFS